MVIFDMSQRELKLVWVNEALLAAPTKNPKPKDKGINPPASRLTRAWNWAKTNGSAVSMCIALLILGGNVVGYVVYVSKAFIQLEIIEGHLNGPDGLIKRVDELRSDVSWMKGFVSGAYRQKAAAEGFKTDRVRIFPINVSTPQSTKNPVFQEAQTTKKVPYSLQVNLLSANHQEMVFSISGKVGNTTLEDVREAILVKPGKQSN